MYEHVSERLLPFREFAWRLAGHAGAIAVVVAGSLGLGMIGYHVLAPMPWIDAFLNAAMILGGMGPVNPMTNDRLKLFAGLYALYAGLVFVASLGIIVAPVIHRILHRLHAEEDQS